MSATTSPPTDDGDGIPRELMKLRKINQVLMDRVERATDWQGNAFSLFQAATVLEGQVAERTAALRAANDALRNAKDAAEQANISKTKFLAAASHDLLQPLNAAKLFTAALAERGEADPGKAGLVSSIGDALDSIDMLLRALFDISKLDAGAMNAEIRDTPLGPLLAQLERDYAPQVANAGLEFKVVPCSLTVRTDPRLLTRVLWNFVSNAIRYTEQGRIVLGCRRRGNVVTVEVYDTGVGIPEHRLCEIFEEFRQIGPPGRGRDKGLGLGLAIVDRISRLLDHPIRVRSQVGKGSTFGIDLPVVAGGAAQAEIPAAAVPPSRAIDLSGLSILVIDDDARGLRALSELLVAWGCNVTPKHSWAEVDRWLKTWPEVPDLVIADYHLGDGRDGIGVIEKVRSAYGIAIPAFVVTSDRAPELKARLKSKHLNMLNKPIQPAALRAVISHVMGGTARTAARPGG